MIILFFQYNICLKKLTKREIHFLNPYLLSHLSFSFRPFSLKYVWFTLQISFEKTKIRVNLHPIAFSSHFSSYTIVHAFIKEAQEINFEFSFMN